MADYNKIKTIVMQVVALICLNIAGFIYDGQWLYFAVGIDASVLGYTLNGYAKEKKLSSEKT